MLALTYRALSKRLRLPVWDIGRVSTAVWRELAWLSVGQLFSVIGVIAAGRVVTTLLSPEAYGELALGMTLATLASQVALGPLSNAAERFFILAKETGGLSDFLIATRRLTVATSAIVLAVGAIVCAGVWAIEPQWLLLACASVVFALLSGWDKILSGIQNAARQRATVAWHQAFREWLKVVVAAGALLIFHSSASALFAYALASLGVLGSQVVFLRRLISTFPSFSVRAVESELIRGRMLRYALPFGAYGTFTWLQLASDRWSLQWFADTSSVGLYAAVAQIGAYPLTILTGLLMQLVAPILFSQAGDGRDRGRVAQAMRLLAVVCAGMLVLTLLGCVISLLGHRLIFGLLIGSQFGQVSYLLPLSVFSSGVFNAGQVASLAPLILGDSRSLLIPTIGAAALSVFMNMAGAYLFGIEGVLAALIAYSLCYASSVTLVGVRRFRALYNEGGAG